MADNTTVRFSATITHGGVNTPPAEIEVAYVTPVTVTGVTLEEGGGVTLEGGGVILPEIQRLSIGIPIITLPGDPSAIGQLTLGTDTRPLLVRVTLPIGVMIGDLLEVALVSFETRRVVVSTEDIASGSITLEFDVQQVPGYGG